MRKSNNKERNIKQEFLNRITDKANKLIARIYLLSNFTCLILFVAHYYGLFNTNYNFTFLCESVILYFSISMFIFCKLSFNRVFVMYHGLIGAVIIISLMGSNSTIGVNICYAMTALFSCMYLVKRYTIIASTLGYIGMVISLFLKSINSETTEYFIPILTGFSIEYILLLLTCTAITELLRKTVLDLQDQTDQIRIMQTKELQTFAKIVECRDNFTGKHIERTSKYVNLLSNELAKTDKYKKTLTTDVINIITEAAPLHDIGKIQIPDSILKKEGKLTTKEYEIMKSHSEIGYNMIGSYFNEVIDDELLMYSQMMALYHHERFDGKGYPKGLKGEAIPICARIMTVADVLDALLSKRHYKDPFSIEETIDIIKKETEKMFDPDIVKCLIKIIPEVIKIKDASNNTDDLYADVEEI